MTTPPRSGPGDCGHLFGVGVGPGDPELMTIKARRIVESCAVVAHFAAKGRPGNAWTIVEPLIADHQTVLRLEYPVTTQRIDRSEYEERLGELYDAAAGAIADELDQGQDVAVVCEGDPFFYGSYMYLHHRLSSRYATTVVPGVTSVSAATAVAGLPLVSLNESLTVLPGVLPPEELKEALTGVDAAVVMKVGRHLDAVREALEAVDMAEHAVYVERASCRAGARPPAARVRGGRGPVLLARAHPGLGGGPPAQGAAVTGRLSIVGLGPGRADWCTPAVLERLERATDLVGYAPYLALIAVPTQGRRHPSGNRVEAHRACQALDLADAGGDVVVVSSGDPGVFGMASAVLEQLDACPERWREVEVEVLPGITAALALASRVGAPLGHDYCVVSLSDVLKPWAVIERRLDAAAAADFVIAIYNPRSRHRPHAARGRARDRWSPPRRQHSRRRRAQRGAGGRAGRRHRPRAPRSHGGRHEHRRRRRLVRHARTLDRGRSASVYTPRSVDREGASA